MKVQEILNTIEVGNSVAEFDNQLKNYFVETDIFRALIEDKADIIAGDKGTGKTALYRYLHHRYTEFNELANVELITAFNPSGNPIFQRLAYTGPLDEGQYSAIWKMYILSLVGNWLLQLCDGVYLENTQKLSNLLAQTGLRSQDDRPVTIFSRLTQWVQRFTNPKAAGIDVTFDISGIPVVTPKIEFEDPVPKVADFSSDFILHDDALYLLNASLAENDITIWIALDRLDEAFVGFPDVEMPALRALFRTYLDLLAFERIKLKLFVRKDLFRKITQNRFVNLTHINARKREIIWDKEDLLVMLCRRLRENKAFLALVDRPDVLNEQLFDFIFPEQVDVGERRSTTWNWMISHTKDGNGAIPPRNLIDLVNKAKEEQLRREQRQPRVYVDRLPLIEPEAIKRALTRLSHDRLEDTLLAEASRDVAVLIEAFRDSKAEHNDDSIAELFGVDKLKAKSFAKILIDIGFFEQTKESYKIPILYRDGLNITLGKAY
ncbi:MAG: hypothetical protein KDJ52_18155 [Anaerolineae bacterium]|nr:hypothetical protein [Anaerolineae bacterium]